jgi:hypothetical protein
VVVVSGFMLKVNIKRPWYATPVWPDFAKSGRIFRPLSLLIVFMIETTRSQELKGDKHAQEV